MENFENYSSTSDQVVLRKLRNFNDIINVTFAFIKQEHQRLLKVLLYYLGPVVLIQSIASAYYQAKILNLTQNLASAGNDPMAMFQNLVTIEYFILIIASIVSSILSVSLVYSYFNLYDIKGKDGFNEEDVFRGALNQFLNVFVLSIIIGIFVIIGFMLFIIPGIYIFVPFSLMFAIRIIEGHGIGDSFNRAFYLVKNNWWNTFLIIIVISLIAYFAGLVFTLPQSLMSMWSVITSVSETGEQDVSILYIILAAVGQFFVTLLYVLPNITIGFQYFSLVEDKDSPNLYNQVDSLGR